MMLQTPSSRRKAAAAAALFILALGAAALCDATLAADAAQAPHWLVSVGLFATEFGTSGYMFAFSALIAGIAIRALGRGRTTWQGGSLRLVAERALYFFATIAVSGLLVQIVKHVVGRARPPLLSVDGAFHFQGFVTKNALASFPSGHTTSAFAAAVALGYMRPAWRKGLLGLAVLIGLSRVLVGAHFPSDVVAGAALGSTVSIALARSFARRGLAFTTRAGRTRILPLRSAPTV